MENTSNWCKTKKFLRKCSSCNNVKNLDCFYSRKNSIRSECKKCENKRVYFYRKNKPWVRTLESIKYRCNNKNSPKYHRYGERGIKCLITKEEVKFLWFRDKAYLLKKPSIDRINNDGNYELSNCRYIETSENSRKDKIKKKEGINENIIFL